MFWVRIKPDGGEPFDIEVDTRDGLKWEKQKTGRSIRKFEEAGSFADLYSLTFQAVLRDGRFGGDINEFEERCAIERLPDPAEGEEGPTRPAR